MAQLQVEAAPETTTRLWTPANIVTLVRICLVPVFVVALLSPWPQWFNLPDIAEYSKSLIAAGIFVLISCTDWLDGYLARSRGEVTDFGKFMDPLADKILVVAALLALIELGVLPSWVALIIVAREFIVSGVRMVAASKGVVISASWYGKFKTVFQMIAIVMFTVKDSYMMGTLIDAFCDMMWVLSWAVMFVALALTIVSMLDYISKARDLIGLGPRKGKKAKASRGEAESKQVAQEGNGGIAKASDEAKEAEGIEVTDSQLESLAASVLSQARQQGLTVGTAESLTGGMISAALTAVPGSSDVMRGGVVSYAVSVKESELAVSEETVDKHGVVSCQVAEQMAVGACSALGCDAAVAVTGIAGPGGAEPNKPVGTVCFGIACNGNVSSQTVHFEGDRNQVRRQTTRHALRLIENAVSASK